MGPRSARRRRGAARRTFLLVLRGPEHAHRWAGPARGGRRRSWPAPTPAQLSATEPETARQPDPAAERAARLDPREVALLGDAAHAMEPNFGQGAAQAIEDAEALFVALAEAMSCPPRWPPTRRRGGGARAVPEGVLALRPTGAHHSRRPARPLDADESGVGAPSPDGAPAAAPLSASAGRGLAREASVMRPPRETPGPDERRKRGRHHARRLLVVRGDRLEPTDPDGRFVATAAGW